jgi:hypothetical protein
MFKPFNEVANWCKVSALHLGSHGTLWTVSSRGSQSHDYYLGWIYNRSTLLSQYHNLLLPFWSTFCLVLLHPTQYCTVQLIKLRVCQPGISWSTRYTGDPCYRPDTWALYFLVTSMMFTVTPLTSYTYVYICISHVYKLAGTLYRTINLLPLFCCTPTSDRVYIVADWWCSTYRTKAYIYYSAAHRLVGLCSSCSRNTVEYYIRTETMLKRFKHKLATSLD